MDPTLRTQLSLATKSLATICVSKSLKIVTAESCTGGGVAYELTAISRSSEWFERGVVTYSNLSKIELLEVKANTIQKFGAVSEEVAEEMAQGALKKSAADISLSITGIAGPEGGNEKKPVGTCWFGWANKKRSLCKLELFTGDRIFIRDQAILYGIEGLLHFIHAHY